MALQEVEILRDISNAKNTKVLGSMTKEKMEETQDLMVKYMDLEESGDGERDLHQRLPGVRDDE